MSWEVFVVSIDGRFRSRNEAAEDEHLLDLGTKAEVIDAIVESFPGTQWSDGWGRWEGDGGTVTFDIGDEEPVQTLDLHVDTDDEDVVVRILDLTGSQGWRAGDSGDGDFLDLLDDPAVGLRAVRSRGRIG